MFPVWISHTDRFFLLYSFTQLQCLCLLFSLSIQLLMFMCAKFFASECVCEFILSNVCTISCLREKGDILSRFVLRKMQCHHQCVIMWHWRSVVCRRMRHLTLLTGVDCYTTSTLTRSCVRTHSRRQSKILCVCYCHTSVSHWGHPTPENACRTAICEKDHLEIVLPTEGWLRVFQYVSRDVTHVLVIHQREFWPLYGTN